MTMNGNSPLRRSTRATLLVAGLLSATLLGGCVRFGAKPPASLLTVESNARVAPGTVAAADKGVVTIIEPDVPKALSTVRVAVRTGDTSFAYVPKAYWVDTPRNLFRAVVAETVASRNSVLVLDGGQFSAAPGKRLTGDLVEFGIDARARQAVVTYDATLVGSGGVLSKRRFTATAPVRDIDSNGVAPAIGVAANGVAVQVADWLKTL
ncbi:ABC-type transport auxiliary lipoprotein family protein [Sphingobium sufflavum]|uniref:ABC-type transport auxiliary lipoprotein family protein n=1 Tax=Sphingobium sufflavum TaxID=1129547 RepID=UPI001F468076|nr:ABC-type transport auxiliary lipoprotein family protein [Sphingobium sufflavum]MCE7795185.1 ABC-type transport auxiliary lipoprotein family protein [Sphingobium sufflavum]